MPRDIRVRVGRTIRDQSLSDAVAATDSVSRAFDAFRAPADGVGLGDSMVPDLNTAPSSNSSHLVYPTLATHPYAQWNRSGNTLTSAGRRDFPVYDSTDGFDLGTTEPTWDNSGCRIPLSNLTTNTTTNLITTADGQVISGLYLPYGRIEVRHKNVTIRDCVIQIGWDSARGMINGNNAVVCNPAYDTTGWRLEYVTSDPVNAAGGDTYAGTVYQYNTTDGGATWTFTNAAGSGNDSAVGGFYMIGEGYAWRCAARNVTDAFMPDNQFSRSTPTGAAHIWGCYLQTRWMSHDPQNGDGTHNDGVQFTGNDGNTMVGCSVVAPPGNILEPNTGYRTKGQGVVITPYHSSKGTDGLQQSAQETATVIYKNWFSGSYTQVAAWCPNWQGGPSQPNLQVIGNRHKGTCVWMILVSPSTNAVKQSISGNVVGSGGVNWNNGTTGAGAAANVNVAAVSGEMSAPQTGGAATPNLSHAGNDRIVEPGTRVYLVGKGIGATQTSWIKTGTWSRVSATGPALTTGTTSDGYTYAYLDAPTGNPGAVTTTYQFQATGLTDTDTVTVTVAPDQSVTVPTISVANVTQGVSYSTSTTVTRTTTAGRTLVACVGHQSRLAASEVTLTDTAGNVWQRAAMSETAGATSEGRDSIWYCVGAASITSLTASVTGSSTVVAVTLYELVNAGGGLRQATAAWSGTSPIETQVTAVAGDFVVGIGGRYNTAPTTSTAGYTQQTPLNVTTTYYTSAHTIAAASGNTAPTWAGAGTTGMVTVAIVPG